RSQIVTSAPRQAACRASCRPSPRAPPVISTRASRRGVPWYMDELLPRGGLPPRVAGGPRAETGFRALGADDPGGPGSCSVQAELVALGVAHHEEADAHRPVRLVPLQAGP